MSVGPKKLLKALGKLTPTDWKPATSAGRAATDYQRHIEQKLDYFKFRNSAPIRTIIETPADLRVASGLGNSALLVALMNNMYSYGRQHWKWVRASPKGAQEPYEDAVKVHIASLDFPAQLRWKNGRGLLDGTVASAVCGSFNAAFKFVAQEIFDIPSVKAATGDATTQISDSFITLPGRAPIDSQWKGNVWYIDDTGDVSAGRRSNEQIRALRFTGHFFCNHNSTIYDVTGNATFKDAKEMIWCYLDQNPAKQKDFPGARGVFNLRVQNPSATVRAAKYCIDMGEEPGDNERFSNWALTDRESMTAQQLQTLSTWSSCS